MCGLHQAAAGLPTGSAEPRGNVQVSGCHSVAFNNCSFLNLGGAYALSAMEVRSPPLSLSFILSDCRESPLAHPKVSGVRVSRAELGVPWWGEGPFSMVFLRLQPPWLRRRKEGRDAVGSWKGIRCECAQPIHQH